MVPPLRTVLALALVAAPSFAHAQPAPAPAPAPVELAEPEREGLLVGAGVGVGRMFVVCDGCADSGDNGLVVDANLGWFVTPGFAVLLDVSVALHAESDDVFVTATGAAAAQTFLTSKLWARGGLGIGYRDTVDSDAGFALSGAIGYDLIEANGLALDARLRATNGFYEGANITSAGLLVGASWY